MDDVIKIGQWTAPVLMAGLLGIIFSFFTKDDGTSTISNRIKNGIALCLGILLAFIALILKWDAGGYAVSITDGIIFALAGIMVGATSVGLWKSFNIQIRNQKE
jgi:hypothetical protein